MGNKILIYSKQSGENLVPVTVRIKWFPDGTIKPLRYWMPDGTQYRVVANLEWVSLAFLKDGGEGLRLKVKSEIIETPNLDIGLLHTWHETYLYLADRRFCEKNIIDERYGHPGKAYIPVVMDVFPNGDYELICFWVNRAQYMVEKTFHKEPRGSFKAGGIGIQHKVEVRLVSDDEPNA